MTRLASPMVIYDLICDNEHHFEGWFPKPEDFDTQKSGGLIQCNFCGSIKVRKIPSGGHVVSASAVPQKGPQALPSAASPRETVANVDPVVFMKMMHHYVKKNCENVGPKFAEEARKIFHGESEKKNIYGTTTLEEQEALYEEGVPFVPLPEIPDEFNN